MKNEVETARAALWAYIQTGSRANRRRALKAFSLVNKAALVLGLAKLERKLPKSAPQKVVYPATTEAKEVATAPETGTVIADNVNRDEAGPEKPRRKTKGV